MNRKINLISHESQTIQGLENIPINTLESIFSYSCEMLICKTFNIFDETISQQAFTVLFDKIRPQGQLIVGTIDFKQICSDYLHRKLDNKQFFELLHNSHNHVGVDDIMQYINSLENALVIDIKTDQYTNYTTIIKTKP